MSDLRQTTWPKVTVVVVNWNGEQFLERCLDALIDQTFNPREIILVDNASTKLVALECALLIDGAIDRGDQNISGRIESIATI